MLHSTKRSDYIIKTTPNSVFWVHLAKLMKDIIFSLLLLFSASPFRWRCFQPRWKTWRFISLQKPKCGKRTIPSNSDAFIRHYGVFIPVNIWQHRYLFNFIIAPQVIADDPQSSIVTMDIGRDHINTSCYSQMREVLWCLMSCPACVLCNF